MQISVSSLSKQYRVINKEDGLKGSIKSLFCREYKTVEAVKEINFDIKEGERVGFIGSNGAGKTTTIKMLTGLIHPTSGDIKVLGYSPWERKNEFKREISLVMGNKFQLWWDLPAIESLNLNRKIYDIPQGQYNETVEELSSLLQVEHLLKTPVKQLSLGERMKMEIIAGLIHKPKVMFLDEPTIGLDLESQKTVRKFLQEYNEKQGTTILMTSHYIEDIEAVCDRLIMISKGRIIFDGLRDDLAMNESLETAIEHYFREKGVR